MRPAPRVVQAEVAADAAAAVTAADVAGAAEVAAGETDPNAPQLVRNRLQVGALVAVTVPQLKPQGANRLKRYVCGFDL